MDKIDLVRQIVATQSPGYGIAPDASAFWAAGLTDSNEVDALLLELEQQGHVTILEEEMITKTSEQQFLDMTPEEREELDGAMPQPELGMVSVGWVITEAGKTAAQHS